MAEDPLELTVQTLVHPRGWILVPVEVGTMFVLQFVLNTGYLFSAINSRTRTVLGAMGHLEQADRRTLSLRDLSLAGRPLPDLEVRVSPALSVIGVEGILGLNFLRQFDDIHFNVPSGRLVLRR